MWIEIITQLDIRKVKEVTPFTGVWIEIDKDYQNFKLSGASLPLRECGLKSRTRRFLCLLQIVTPFTGVWIEISTFPGSLNSTSGHSLYGSVD